MELGIGLSVLGLGIAVAFGLPSFFAYLRDRKEQTISKVNQKLIEEMEKKVGRLEISQELVRECLEGLTTTVLVHQAMVREFGSSETEKVDIADEIIFEQRERLMRKLLHVELLQKEFDLALISAHQLATEYGNVASLRMLRDVESQSIGEQAIEFKRHSKVLESRLSNSE